MSAKWRIEFKTLAATQEHTEVEYCTTTPGTYYKPLCLKNEDHQYIVSMLYSR